ncbi:MAG: hypothetical protein ACOYOS_17085, partial [Syntrophales bacterium]
YLLQSPPVNGSEGFFLLSLLVFAVPEYSAKAIITAAYPSEMGVLDRPLGQFDGFRPIANRRFRVRGQDPGQIVLDLWGVGFDFQ